MSALLIQRLIWSLLILVTILLSTFPVRAQSRGPVIKRGSPPVGQKTAASRSIAFDQITTRASAAREANQLNESIGLYRQALQMRPSWAEGWWYVGTLFYELDRYKEARDAFRRFVALEPKGGPAWALMGLCEFQLREYERALSDIEHGRRLGLSDNEQLKFVTRYHHAILLTRFEQFEAALEILSYLARTLLNENPIITEALGLSILRMPLLPAELPADKRELVMKAGKAASDQFTLHPTEAQREYQQLAALYPETPHVHYAYGVFLLHERADAALEEFRRELKISPSHVPARLQIAFTLINKHEYASALPFAEEAVQLAPGAFAARNALGRILTETGDVARAIKELEVGVRLAPDSPEMYFALARAYSRAGRKADAEQARANFVRLDKARRALREGTQTADTPEIKTDNQSPK